MSKQQGHGKHKPAPKQQPLQSKEPESASLEHQILPQHIIPQARLAPNLLTSRDVLQLQRTIGNQAVGRLLARGQPAQPSPPDQEAVQTKGGPSAAIQATSLITSNQAHDVVQRRNNATPENFRVTSAEKVDRNVTVITHHEWTSSTREKDDLIDVEMRERVDFDQNPTINMPGYATWVANPINNATLAGTTLIKNSGRMNSLTATDEHSGAGYNPSFLSENGAQNLRKAAWNLTANQHYQYKTPEGAWTNLHDDAFTLTRQMQQAGAHYELTFRKTGPGVDQTAGPTPIAERNTKQDMEALYAARPNNNADWDTAKQQIQGAGFRWERIETQVRNVAGGRTVPVKYWAVVPQEGADVNQAAILSRNDLSTMKSNVKSGVNKVISDLKDAGHPIPNRIHIFLSGLGDPRQQAWYVEPTPLERVFIILFKRSKMMAPEAAQSRAGAEAAEAWFERGKRKRWQKATAIHEMGHLMHALTTPAKFMNATESVDGVAGRYQRRATQEDPPRNIDQDQALAEADPREVHVARINDQIKRAALLKYVAAPDLTWMYATDNPAEIVAEVFSALTHGRRVPKGLAAVYIAYGGVRSATIERRLAGIFDGNIPALTQPEQALPFIEQDP